MNDFWQKLRKPFVALAPMYGVTDYSYREVLARVGRPDVFFTEFVPARIFGSQGEERTLRSLKFSNRQRPIVAQVWGIEPDFFGLATKRIAKLGFDGIDLNFGCPDREVVKKGAGAALIKNPKLAKKLIEAVRENAGELAVSIKTRIAGDKGETRDWLSFLLDQKVDAITVHGRTVGQRYDRPADWSAVGELVKMRDRKKAKTVIVGNGDVDTIESGIEKAGEFGLDGVMIGRAALANPWVFTGEEEPLDPKTRLSLLLEHTKIYHEAQEGDHNFGFIKKFFKTYSSHFPGAVELRCQLMKCGGYNEVEKLIEKFGGSQ
jgi:tRNA-dihydrouridine synthase